MVIFIAVTAIIMVGGLISIACICHVADGMYKNHHD